MPLIHPFDTSVQNINLDRRSWKIEFGFRSNVYTSGHSADWCPRQTRYFFIEKESLLLSSSIASSFPFPYLPTTTATIFEVVLRKLDFGSFHPTEKNMYSPRRIHVHKGASHSSWTTHAVGHLWKEREKKSGADGYDHGNGKYDFGYFPLLSRRANNSTIVERAKTRKNPICS